MIYFESDQDFYTKLARIASIGLSEPGSWSSKHRWENCRSWMEGNSYAHRLNLHKAMGYRADQAEY